VRFLDLAADAAGRAVPRAERAAFALRRVDLVLQESLADAGRALLVDNVRDILITEIPQSGKDGVRSRDTEKTHCRLLISSPGTPDLIAEREFPSFSLYAGELLVSLSPSHYPPDYRP
jgi:hypothetical protein